MEKKKKYPALSKKQSPSLNSTRKSQLEPMDEYAKNERAPHLMVSKSAHVKAVSHRPSYISRKIKTQHSTTHNKHDSKRSTVKSQAAIRHKNLEKPFVRQRRRGVHSWTANHQEKIRSKYDESVSAAPCEVSSISRAALNATCSPRIIELSRPKHQPNRKRRARSTSNVSPYALVAYPSPRIELLAIPKQYPLAHPQCVLMNSDSMKLANRGKSSREMWLSHMSEMNPMNYGYKPVHDSIGAVSDSALEYRISRRIKRLAKPVVRPCPDYLEIRPKMVCNFVPSDRLLNLAKPKQLHPSYRPPNREPGVILPCTLSYTPSERLQKLASPIKRKESNTYRDQHVAFSVSKPALVAVASERIQELAKPLDRWPPSKSKRAATRRRRATIV